MSIFTHRVTKTLEIPDTNPIETVTIRKLAPRHLEAAARVSMQRSLASVQDIGGPTLVKEFMALTERASTSAPTESAGDPLLGSFDALTLIEKGVVAWSCDEKLSAESIAELDEDTVDWLAREVLRLARPRLFQTAEEAQADRGNASRPSTAP